MCNLQICTAHQCFKGTSPFIPRIENGPFYRFSVASHGSSRRSLALEYFTKIGSLNPKINLHLDKVENSLYISSLKYMYFLNSGRAYDLSLPCLGHAISSARRLLSCAAWTCSCSLLTLNTNCTAGPSKGQVDAIVRLIEYKQWEKDPEHVEERQVYPKIHEVTRVEIGVSAQPFRGECHKTLLYQPLFAY